MLNFTTSPKVSQRILSLLVDNNCATTNPNHTAFLGVTLNNTTEIIGTETLDDALEALKALKSLYNNLSYVIVTK